MFGRKTMGSLIADFTKGAKAILDEQKKAVEEGEKAIAEQQAKVDAARAEAEKAETFIANVEAMAVPKSAE